MRKVIFMFAVVLLTLTVSCTKEREVIVVVPNVEVHLSTKSVFNVESEDFRSTTRSTYVHQYPINYKAYFIANETKGPYTSGQLVTTINVIEGMQTVTIPKLSYKVYVTNFEHTSEGWYTWDDALDQMPLASDVLYLFGSNVIDYGTQLTGEVLIKNPWSAIMIENHEYFDPNRSPREYNSGSNYVATGDGWWIKYVRNHHNTGVWLKYPGMTGNLQRGISSDVLPNKVYKYRMSTPTTSEEDNFTVEVEKFDEVIEIDWGLW